MGNKIHAGLGLAFVFLIQQSAWGISDSLVSAQFEADVAKKSVEYIARFKTVKELLLSLPSGNRNDIYYVNDLIERFGERALPSMTVEGSLIRLSSGSEKSQFEIVSSLERAYVINEIKVQLSPSESLESLIERMERVYKLRKQRIVQSFILQFLLGHQSFAGDERPFYDKHPEFNTDAIVWGAIAVGMEQRIVFQAKKSFAEHAPVAAALTQSLHADLGTHSLVEVSCVPRYINVGDQDRSGTYQSLLNQCCQDSTGQCEHVINSISNSEHPELQVVRKPAKAITSYYNIRR